MSRGRVLVVDDDPAMLESLADVLDLDGWEVVTAADGEAAVLRACELELRAVIMDVRMPRMDGAQALRLVKAARPALPVILVTAMAAPGVLEQAQRDGAFRTLLKPVEPAVLLAALHEATAAPAP